MFSRVNKLLKISPNDLRSLRRFWNVNICGSDQAVILKHATSGEVLQFPTVWLRDNCQCTSCFNETLHSRLIPFTEFKGALLPKSAACSKSDSGNACLEVQWPDSHESVFPLQWLREHSFDENVHNTWLKNNYKYGKTTWNASNFKDTLRRFSFDDVMNNDLELLKWLLTLNRTGIAIVENIGNDESQLEKLTTKIGFSKMTTYGKQYNVEAKENATNSAYRAAPLSLHVDLPYYEYIPSVNLLHFVVQSTVENEGVNQVVDGLEVCRQLKNYDENMYRTLANIPVEWTDKGTDSIYEFFHVHRAPVICENSLGDIVRLNVSQPQRDAHFCVTVKRANEWYTAMNWFLNIAHSPKNLISVKMKEGDLLSFDNSRVLHGRSGFSTKRKVAGAYMDWDIINSKIRMIISKLNIKNVDEIGLG